MASPFSVFRKNQKVWMAGITIMAIFAFVFLGGPMSRLSSGPGGHDEAVVRTRKFGNLTRGNLQTLKLNRIVFNEFLNAVEASLAASKEPAYTVAAVKNVIGTRGNGEIVNTEDVVNKWLFAREAEAMGITVDDKLESAFLEYLANHKGLDVSGILKSIRQGVAPATFRSILREELLALRYRQLFHQIDTMTDLWIGGAATPGERWTFFRRINEHATVELARLAPQDFVKQVPEPSEETLKEFFEEHKNDYASPFSPNPGFHVPRKVNLQYLQADEEKYEPKVTEDEITERYKKDPQSYAREKEEFENLEKQEKADREKEEAAIKAAAEKKPKDEKKPTTEKKPEVEKKTDAEKKPEPEKKTDAEKKANTEKKPEAEKKPDASKTTPADPKAAADAKPAAETKPKLDSKGPEPAKAATVPKPSGSSMNAGRSPFRLVAFAEDKTGEKAAATKDDKKESASPSAVPPAAKPAEDKKPAEVKKATNDKNPTGEKKPADDKNPAGSKKPADEKKPDAGKKTSDDQKAGAKSAASDSANKPSESKTPSLPPIKTAEQRLREKIRKDIAREKLQDQLNKVQTLLVTYRRKEWVHYDADAKMNPGAKMPAPPSFAALANEYTMSAGITGLISLNDLRYNPSLRDFGDSVVIQKRMSVVQIAFGATTLYLPDVSEGFVTRNFYVFWKTDDQPDHIPKWEDNGIQAEVRQTWKLSEARKLAMKRANALKAEAAAKPGKSLTELGSSVTVLKPLPFSFWMNKYGQLQLGEVLGFDKSDDKGFKQKAFSLDKLSEPYSLVSPFMQTVFSLTPNQVGVAANVPQTEIYVVRVVEFTPFDELWPNFTADAEDWSVYTLLTRNGGQEETAGLRRMIFDLQSEVSRAWIARVYADAGLKWEKSAEQQRPVADDQSPGPIPSDED